MPTNGNFRLTFRRKRLFAFAAIIVVVALSIVWFLFRGKNTSVVVVQRGDLVQTVVATGRIESPARIEIASVALGKITHIDVDEGSQIIAGQRLLELDSKEARAARDQALASLRTAQVRLEQLEAVTALVTAENVKQATANLELARTKFLQAQNLLTDGFITQAQFDESRLSMELAQSALESAKLLAASQLPDGSDYKLAHAAVQESRARLHLTETQLANMSIVAPVAATVISRLVEVGDTAQPGKPLLVLAKTGAVQAAADVDEKNLLYLRLGQEAWVSADAYSGERIPAKLSFIAPAVDAARGTVEIKLDVNNAPTYLRPDMTVTVEIVVRSARDVLVLPANAVRDINSGKPWVLLIHDKRTQRRDVVLGTKGEGELEIVSGLSEGDNVVPGIETKVGVEQRVRPRVDKGR